MTDFWHKYHIYLGLVILLLIITTVYWQSLDNNMLYWDDYFQIPDKSLFSQINDLKLRQLFVPQPNTLGMYQPLTTLLFGIEKHWLTATWHDFHVFSLIWHLINTILVFWLILLVTQRKRLSLIVSSLFAISPVNTEAVVWISAKSTLLYSCFSLLTLIIYWYHLNSKSKNILWYFIALIFFLFALLAKTPAIAIVPIILLLDWSKTKKLTVSLIKILPFAVAAIYAVATAILIRFLSHETPSELPDYSLFELIIINTANLGRCFVKIILPLYPSALDPYPTLTNGSLPNEIYLWAIATLIILIIWIKKAFSNTTILAIGLTFIVGSLVFMKWDKSSTPFIADRYLYLTCIPIYYGLVLYLTKLRLKKLQKILILGCYLLTLAMLSNLAAEHWQNDISFWSYVIDRHPNFTRAYGNRGFTYTIVRDYENALDDFRTCSMLDKNNSFCLGNQGVVLHDALSQFEKARDIAKLTIEQNPLNATAYYRLALSEKSLGNNQASKQALKKALIIDPANPDFLELSKYSP